MTDGHGDQGGGASDEARLLRFGPSGAELFRIFRLPGLCAAIGIFFIVLGQVAGGTWVTLLVGALVVALAVVLTVMEWIDLKHSWMRWDAVQVVLGRGKGESLSIRWTDLAELSLKEVVLTRRFHFRQRRLWLEARPLRWRDFVRSHPGYEAYTSHMLADFTVGIAVSEGSRRREAIDRTLRESGCGCYVGKESAEVELGRWDTRPGKGAHR